MKQKIFMLAEKDIEIINSVREQQGLKSNAEAVRYILRNYDKTTDQQNKIQIAIMRGIEEKVDLLLDIANTDLIKRDEKSVYPVSMAESEVITKAREVRTTRLSNMKQKADYRSRRKKS